MQAAKTLPFESRHTYSEENGLIAYGVRKAEKAWNVEKGKILLKC